MNISNNEEKGFKRIFMPMCDRRVASDVSNEFTVPDYKPEIRRILHVNPVISQAAKYVNSNTVEFNGNIDYNVLYVGSDGELHSMPFSAEYSFNTPIDAEGFDLNDEITSCCDTMTDSISVRVLGPRKINVKCRLNSQVRIYGRKFIDQNFDLSDSSEHIETLEEKVKNARIIRVDADTLEISDETFVSSGNYRVISGSANLHTLSVRPQNDMVSVDGEVILKMLCVDLDDSAKSNVITKKIPYSTEIEADGISPDSMCIVKGYTPDLAISVEEDRIICDMSLCLQLEAHNDEELSLVRDVYSTKYKSSCSVVSCELPSVGFAEIGNFSMNEKLTRESIGLPESFQIIDVYSSAVADECRYGDKKAELRGTAKYTLIIKINDEYSSHEVTLPVKYVFDCPDKNIASYNSEINVISCSARCDGEIISIDAELAVTSIGVSTSFVTVVDNVVFGETVARTKGEITVVYPGADDDVWSVAKRYHVPVSEIEAKNPAVATLGITSYLIV